MAYLAKQRMYYYKKYKLDIWNSFKNTLLLIDSSTRYMSKYKNKHTTERKLERVFTYHAITSEKTQAQLNLLLNKEKEDKEKNKEKEDKEKNKEKEDKIQIQIQTLKKTIHKSEWFKSEIISWVILQENFGAFFECTVSKKFSILFDKVFLEEDGVYQKIFFKIPFMYDSRIPKKRKKKRKVNEQYVSLRLIKLFYIMYNHRQLKRMAKKAKLQSGVFEQNYLLMVECKLPQYLYRISFFPTIFDSLEFVREGNVWVNKQFKPLINYSIKLFDIVGFRVIYKSYIFWSFYKRLKRKAFAFMLSRCIFVSFHFLFTVLISRFTLEDLVNPFPFDYYRVANYAQ